MAVADSIKRLVWTPPPAVRNYTHAGGGLLARNAKFPREAEPGVRMMPVVLEMPGSPARLEPLSLDHAPGLFEAGRNPEVWRYMPNPPVRSIEEMEAFIGRVLDAAARGTELPFAVVRPGTGEPIGSTRYLDIQPENRGLEIGATWYGPAWQRTGVNTACKYLLLRHAFEAMWEGRGAARVQLKTDARNERSQRAIERIGGVYEGRLRKSRVLHDGFIRDTVYYSIIAEEWAGVKRRLEGMMKRG